MIEAGLLEEREREVRGQIQTLEALHVSPDTVELCSHTADSVLVAAKAVGVGSCVCVRACACVGSHGCVSVLRKRLKKWQLLAIPHSQRLVSDLSRASL